MRKTNYKRENKSFTFQVKAIDDGQGLIEAYGSVFDNTDQGNDVVRPGAFKRTIQNSKSRVQSGKSNFLAMMLWQHNENQPIGGWTDLQEDSHGLLCKGQIILNTQLGREAYELIKAGVINEFSIGYDVPSGGAYYDKSSGVRNLTELRLWEVSPVSFAMNSEAILVGVKGASGKTTWPLADRDTKWDAGQANKDIQKYAADGDDLDWSKVAQCFFWVAENPPTKLGDCKLAFVANIGGKMQAIPQGVISCAGVIQGAMGGVDIPSGDVAGVKAKIAAYYKKMDMSPPWEDNDKSTGRHMTRKTKEKKTVQEHYAEEMCQDLLEDWQDVFVCSLTSAILDAFKIGDDPEQDVSTALDDFKTLVLSKFVPEAVECDLSGYLTDNSYSPADYTIQYGSDSQPNYGYMSSNRRRSAKIGKPISSTNQQIIDAHVKSLKAFAKSAKAAMQDHANAMHDTADTVADLAGNNSKAGRAISAATSQSLNSAAEAMHDHADKALSIMNEHVKAVRTAADDFANTIQGAEPAYDGNDPGKPDDGQQEGKSNPAIPPQEAHSPQTHSHKSTVDEDEREFELALASLVQELKCC